MRRGFGYAAIQGLFLLASSTIPTWLYTVAGVLVALFGVWLIVNRIASDLFRLQRQARYESGEALARADADVQSLSKQLEAVRASVREIAVAANRPYSELPDEQSRSEVATQYRAVRELRHALKTPLAGMESILRRQELEPAQGGSPQDIQNLLVSVEICKALLAAFAEVSRVSAEAEVWSPASLDLMMNSAHTVYDDALNRRTRLSTTLPDSVPGYSTNHVVAILLPLLENAIEASPNEGEITVWFAATGGSVELAVGNAVGRQNASANGEIPHEGLGLESVRRLVEDGDGGTVVVNDAGHDFQVKVLLPLEAAR